MSRVYVERESIGDQGAANMKRSPSNAYRIGSVQLNFPATGFPCNFGGFRQPEGHEVPPAMTL